MSNTLEERDVLWQPTTIIRGADLEKRVATLRTQPGGYIYIYGSARLVQTLLGADLVDELLLSLEPIVLGGGKTSAATYAPTTATACPRDQWVDA